MSTLCLEYFLSVCFKQNSEFCPGDKNVMLKCFCATHVFPQKKRQPLAFITHRKPGTLCFDTGYKIGSIKMGQNQKLALIPSKLKKNFNKPYCVLMLSAPLKAPHVHALLPAQHVGGSIDQLFKKSSRFFFLPQEIQTGEAPQ